MRQYEIDESGSFTPTLNLSHIPSETHFLCLRHAVTSAVAYEFRALTLSGVMPTPQRVMSHIHGMVRILALSAPTATQTHLEQYAMRIAQDVFDHLDRGY